MIVIFIKWLLFCLIAVVYFFGKVKIIYYKLSNVPPILFTNLFLYYSHKFKSDFGSVVKGFPD